MWQGVSKNLINLICENKDKKLFRVLMPENSLEISNGLKMLKYIFTEEENNFFPKNFDFSKHVLDVEDKRIGFQVRMIAYINIICSLDRILEKTYQHFMCYIKDIGFKEILPRKKTIEENIKKRKEEVKPFRFWRDKVFAHTAFAQPKREDNLSTQATSLAYFGGSILGYGKKSFQIGGASKVVISPISNEEIKPKSFPIIDIAENHSNIINHFEKWEEMFVEILEKFKTIDKKDIMKKNKNIKKIIF